MGMDNKVTHIVRVDPEGTSEEERERLQAEFAALLASGQPLLDRTPLIMDECGTLGPRDTGSPDDLWLVEGRAPATRLDLPPLDCYGDEGDDEGPQGA